MDEEVLPEASYAQLHEAIQEKVEELRRYHGDRYIDPDGRYDSRKNAGDCLRRGATIYLSKTELDETVKEVRQLYDDTCRYSAVENHKSGHLYRCLQSVVKVFSSIQFRSMQRDLYLIYSEIPTMLVSMATNIYHDMMSPRNVLSDDNMLNIDLYCDLEQIKSLMHRMWLDEGDIDWGDTKHVRKGTFTMDPYDPWSDEIFERREEECDCDEIGEGWKQNVVRSANDQSQYDRYFTSPLGLGFKGVQALNEYLNTGRGGIIDYDIDETSLKGKLACYVQVCGDYRKTKDKHFSSFKCKLDEEFSHFSTFEEITDNLNQCERVMRTTLYALRHLPKIQSALSDIYDDRDYSSGEDDEDDRSGEEGADNGMEAQDPKDVLLEVVKLWQPVVRCLNIMIGEWCRPGKNGSTLIEAGKELLLEMNFSMCKMRDRLPVPNYVSLQQTPPKRIRRQYRRQCANGDMPKPMMSDMEKGIAATLLNDYFGLKLKLDNPVGGCSQCGKWPSPGDERDEYGQSGDEGWESEMCSECEYDNEEYEKSQSMFDD